MDSQKLGHLLQQAKAISSNYKTIANLTGENFNVFRILNLSSSEVRMHSAFLVELLNPKGSHKQKDVFLKLFIDLFCFKEEKFNTENCTVEVEKHVGFISSNGREGGRIDIIVTDKHKNHIIIENKIYAEDKKFQLLRYHTYSSKANLIYLTLNKKDPSIESIGHLEKDKHFKCLTYRTDILKWLELCRKEVATLPTIREGITHYINLIKYLTNQSQNKAMQNELAELISNNIEESFLIANNIDNAYDLISKNFGRKLIDACEAKGLQCKYAINFNNKYSSVWIRKAEWKYLNIGFQSSDKKLRYGFLVDIGKVNLPEDIKTAIASLPGNESGSNDKWWPWARAVESPFDDWSKLAAWKRIQDGSMQKKFMEKIDELLSWAEGYVL